MPSRSTVDRWNKSVPGFEAQCARARLQKGEVFEQKAVSIADAIARGQMDPNAGRSAANIYQWAAKVNCPQRYSDRIDIGNAGGKPFATSSDEDLRAELAALRAKHGPDKE